MGLCNGVDRETVVKGLEQFIADFKPFCGNREDWKKVYDALDLLKEPEVNAEMVVRCRDCKYMPSVPQYDRSCWKNRRRGDNENWYCADGERR